jgi:hypothetical protein
MSHNPMGLHGLLQGELYLFLFLYKNMCFILLYVYEENMTLRGL